MVPHLLNNTTLTRISVMISFPSSQEWTCSTTPRRHPQPIWATVTIGSSADEHVVLEKALLDSGIYSSSAGYRREAADEEREEYWLKRLFARKFPKQNIY